MDDYPGHAKHDPAGRDSGNSRNDHRAKTTLTDMTCMPLSADVKV